MGGLRGAGVMFERLKRFAMTARYEHETKLDEASNLRLVNMYHGVPACAMHHDDGHMHDNGHILTPLV